VLTQIRARLQVADGGVQIVPLAVELAHAHVHVRRSPQRRRTGRRRELQRPLVRAHRLVEPALRNPNIGKDQRTAEGIGEESSPPQSSHALGVHAVSRVQVPLGPKREPEQPRCRAASEVIVLREKVERLAGAPPCFGDIAANQRSAGTVDGDLSRETAEPLLIPDDHRFR
jgi:hypothetical protein